MIGSCRYSTCASALGSEFRFRVGGKPSQTILCAEHTTMVKKALEDDDPTLRVMVSPEGWVYVNFDWSDIRKLA